MWANSPRRCQIQTEHDGAHPLTVHNYDPAELIAVQGELSNFPKNVRHWRVVAETEIGLVSLRNTNERLAQQRPQTELTDVERTLTSVKRQASSPEKAAANWPSVAVN